MLSRRGQAALVVVAVVAVVVAVATGCAPADRAGDRVGTSTLAAPPATVAATPTPSTSADTLTTTSTSSTSTTSAAITTTTVPTATPYVVPVAEVAAAGWGTTHAGYAATDIFIECGAQVVSPVNGRVIEVRTVDRWDPTTDDPATRGGRSVAVLGDEGVRYYVAHLDTIAVVEDQRVGAGDAIATVGRTGRTSACHVHFAISPPCPGPEWSVRRGVIWPYPYLDAWRVGDQLSPVEEVDRWLADHPDGCTEAMADPFAGVG